MIINYNFIDKNSLVNYEINDLIIITIRSIMAKVKTFLLYRVHVPSWDLDLIIHNIQTSKDALREALKSLSLKDCCEEERWKISNIKQLSSNKDQYYFEIGKQKSKLKKTLASYDPEKKEFIDIEEENEDCPYTYILIDIENQICGIALNSSLDRPLRIKRKLIDLLITTSRQRGFGLEIELKPMKDPESLKKLDSTKKIDRFWFTFSRKNLDSTDPIPAQKAIISLFKAKKGRLSMDYPEKTDLVKKVYQEIASQGEDAGFTYARKEKIQPRKNYLTKLDSISIEAEDLKNKSVIKSLFDKFLHRLEEFFNDKG